MLVEEEEVGPQVSLVADCCVINRDREQGHQHLFENYFFKHSPSMTQHFIDVLQCTDLFFLFKNYVRHEEPRLVLHTKKKCGRNSWIFDASEDDSSHASAGVWVRIQFKTTVYSLSKIVLCLLRMYALLIGSEMAKASIVIRAPSTAV